MPPRGAESPSALAGPPQVPALPAGRDRSGARSAAISRAHGALIALAATAACAAGPARSEVPVDRLPVAGLVEAGRLDVGPTGRARPAGAVEARDGDHLRALVADPAGPTDIWLGARTYRGNLTVRRKVRITGSGPLSRLEGDRTGTVIDAAGAGLAFENFAVSGTGSSHTGEDAAVKIKGERNRLARLDLDAVLFGASLQACHDCQVERCRVRGIAAAGNQRGDGIKLWESHGSTVSRCLVEDVRDVVVWYSRHVTIDRCVVRRSRYGCHFMYAHDGKMHDSALVDNVVGVFVMYSARLDVARSVLAGARGPAGVGLGLKDSDDVALTDSWLIGNTVGGYIDASPRDAAKQVVFQGNVIAVNDVALRFHSTPHGVSIRANDIVDNAIVVEVDGGGDATTAKVTDNHWSDYAGFDLDGDGVGDVAFEIKQLSSELTDARPALKLWHGTTALASLDAIARAVPVVAARRLVADPRPAIEPRRLGRTGGDERAR